MLAQEVVHRIERLLADGRLSQRKIARLVGVSRGTVGVIAGGRRPDYEALRRRRQEEEGPRPVGPPRRCPGCGAMVTSDCLACELRHSGPAPRRPRRGDSFELGEAAALELRGEHRRRYERLRARRLAAQDWDASPEATAQAAGGNRTSSTLTPRQLGEALECDDELPDSAPFSDAVPWDE